MPAPLLIANWKMNANPAFAKSFAMGLMQRMGAHKTSAEVVICPPFTLIHLLAEMVAGSGIGVGAQTCRAEEKGAFTGDISAVQLQELGVSHVILGHSERRQHHAETDAMVKAAANAAIAAGIVPIICVGETKAQRDAGGAEAYVAAQAKASCPEAGRFVVAYEPLWAIGSGATPTPKEIAAMHACVRSVVAAHAVVYGGSVTPANAADILNIQGVDGLLIGGASLQLDAFCAIVQMA